MSKANSYSSTQLYQDDFPGKFQSRKLLLHDPLNQISDSSPSSANGFNSLDSNVIMILSVLLCAVVCSLVLNALIKCILNCAIGSDSSDNSSVTRSSVRNKGVKQKALKSFPVVKYSQDLELPGLDSECIICLSEFVNGDRVRLLPKCNHGFHVRCIDKWLKSNSSCPKCRHCLIETCEKIVGCSSSSSATSSEMIQETRVDILPLEREEMIRNPE